MKWNRGAEDISVSVPDQAALLTDLARRFSENQGFTVATLNLDHVVKLDQDPDFARAYAAHSHVTADGNPIVWFSHISGNKAVRLIPGSELILPIAGLADQQAIPVALFGATDASLNAAASGLRQQFPNLNIVLVLAPPMGFDPQGAAADQAIDDIAKSGARLVFLALGAPKQEIFAVRAAKKLETAGFLSIGAGLDFISGAQVRAPRFVRAMAAEWLWRLGHNPRRLAGRYWSCVRVLPRLLWAALAARKKAARD